MLRSVRNVGLFQVRDDTSLLTNGSRFHTIANHSEAALSYGLQHDLQGVLLLMWSATIPIIYYAFICEPKLQRLYWTAVRVVECVRC